MSNQTRPNQSVTTFEKDGDYFVSLSTSGSTHTFYLTQTTAIDLLLSLSDTVQGIEHESYLDRILAIEDYRKTLTKKVGA